MLSECQHAFHISAIDPRILKFKLGDCHFLLNAVSLPFVYRLVDPAFVDSQWPVGSCRSIAQVPRTLIARAATTTIVTNEIVLSSIISTLARAVNGSVSVGLNAVAVENPRNR